MSDNPGGREYLVSEICWSIRSWNCLTKYCGLQDGDPARKILAVERDHIKNFGVKSFLDVCAALTEAGIGAEELAASPFFRMRPRKWRAAWEAAQ